VTGDFQRGLLVRTTGAPITLDNALRHAVWGVDRAVAVTATGTLEDHLQRQSYAKPRFGVILLGVFAAAGLLLVAIGVYSVIAYTVSRHTREIGIRVALGAGRGDVLRLVMGMGLRLVTGGILVGLVASFVGVQLMTSQVWGVSPRDPGTIVGGVLVMVVAGLAACYVPARRAARVDPMVALRHD
jgi:putative ABC transport system permease protein